jgi:hypothetical protein
MGNSSLQQALLKQAGKLGSVRPSRVLAGGGPAAIGLVLLIEVVEDGAITRSPVTIAAALVVGAFLIALPAVLFTIEPEGYRQFEQRMKREGRELADGSEPANPAADTAS